MTQLLYRVFVSYSHDDVEIAMRVEAALRLAGCEPIMDVNMPAGMPITEFIQKSIASCHAFMPIITENSKDRPWVHQETGYAVAMNIPVIPLAYGAQPDQMIHGINSVGIVKSAEHDLPTEDDIKERLEKSVNIGVIVARSAGEPRSVSQLAESRERRTEIVATTAEQLFEEGHIGPVRHLGRFSSFSLPPWPEGHPDWLKYAGKWKKRIPQQMYALYGRERIALEEHAKVAGLRLLINPFSDHLMQFGIAPDRAETTRFRLEVLLEFLLDFVKNAGTEKLEIAFSYLNNPGNLIVIGDWFYAEAVRSGPGGIEQTKLSWHGPSILRRLRAFDRLFDQHKRARPMKPDEAITEIERLIQRLKP